MNRRELIAAAALTALATKAQAGGSFRIFEHLLYQSHPKLKKLRHLEILDRELWTNGVVTNAPDVPAARLAVMPLDPKGSDLVCLDVEHWNINQDEPESLAELAKLYMLLSEVKQQRPDLEFGYYGQIPIRNYWAPVLGGQRKQTWHDRNAAALPLWDLADVYFPSLYTFYPDQEGWRVYAKANIELVKGRGKKIYPFLWPQYHGSAANRFQYIGDDYFRLELETCFEEADGFVIWGAGWDFVNGGRLPWDNPAWYQVVRKFQSEQELL